MSVTREGVTLHTAAWPCGCVFMAAWVGSTADRASFYTAAAATEESAGVAVTTAVGPPFPPISAWAWDHRNPCTSCPPREKDRPEKKGKRKS